jgi:cytochrome c biogenesis protein CcdA/thiol-disulfide isomerase/thioredoxin
VAVVLAGALSAGIIAAISPCVFPVLPVLLAGGASGRKPLRIVAGITLSFAVIVLAASWLLSELGLPQDLLRNVSLALLFLIAATLIVPGLGALLERPLAPLTRMRPRGGGFLLGVSLAPVFTPCGGPVLGYITSTVAAHHIGASTVEITAAYCAGLAIPMLLIAAGGQGLARHLRAHLAGVRLASGIAIAAVALSISFNLDTPFQTLFPGYTTALQQHTEASASVTGALRSLKGVHTTLFAKRALPTATTPVAQAGPGASSLPVLANSAPAIIAGGQWFNSPPLTIAGLRGKVVLLDFWTYSCINCLRTIPHLEAWYTAYHRYGLEIIGVHSPEFAFEHVASNVAAAIKRLGITYPVVQDNNFATWDAYQNEYWPADFLIDQQGRIRAYTYGEGNYGQLETEIRQLLGVSSVGETSVPNLTPTEPNTAEAYLGYTRLDPTRYVGSAIAHNRLKLYPTQRSVPLNALAYSGSWDVHGETAVAGAHAGITLHFQGKDVYMVLAGRGELQVSLAGSPTTTIRVDADRLYTLTTAPSYRTGVLQLRLSAGLQAYSFTFG